MQINNSAESYYYLLSGFFFFKISTELQQFCHLLSSSRIENFILPDSLCGAIFALLSCLKYSNAMTLSWIDIVVIICNAICSVSSSLQSSILPVPYSTIERLTGCGR